MESELVRSSWRSKVQGSAFAFVGKASVPQASRRSSIMQLPLPGQLRTILYSSIGRNIHLTIEEHYFVMEGSTGRASFRSNLSLSPQLQTP